MYAENVLSNLAITAAEGKLASMQFTVMTTATGACVVKEFTLPDWAHAFRIYATAATRYAVNEAPVAASTTTFVVGGILDATTWVTKTIPEGTSRTVQALTSATGVTVTVEVF
jgi:hypothetical protein